MNSEMKSVAVNSLSGIRLTIKYEVSKDELSKTMGEKLQRSVVVVIDKPELVITALESSSSLTNRLQVRDRLSIKKQESLRDEWLLSELMQSGRAASAQLSKEAQQSLKVLNKLKALMQNDECAQMAWVNITPPAIQQELKEFGSVSFL